ncbi:MAG TPA: sarcosine oxidase subunit gamma family protein [Steroidobacteraceae bacterium]|nr:sarcosine oxidase subunit gamma family protein [Steroidobacteraceae bacterium]
MDKSADRRPPSVPATPWLRALPPLRRWALHGERRARDLAASVWGVPFSESACRATLQGSRATLWLGPDEYLLLEVGAYDMGGAPVASTSPPGAPIEGIEGALERALEGTRHALVDLSHRQIALEVSGAHAETILSGACPLDLELCAFPVGMCTRTVLAKADIVLWRTAESRFHLEVWRSFASYATALLAEMALEFYHSPS